MSVRYSKYIPAISVAGDFIILNALFVKVFCLMHPEKNCLASGYLLFYAYLNLIWFVLVVIFGANRINRNTRKKQLVYTYIKIIVFYFFLFLLYFQLTPLSYFSRDAIKYLFPVYFILLLAWKFSLYYAFLYYRKLGYNYRNVLILGYSSKSRELMNYFVGNEWNGYRFLGFIDDRTDKENNIVGSWHDLKKCIEQKDIHELYLSWDRIPQESMVMLTEVINQFPLRVRIVPDLGAFSFKAIEMVNYDLVPVIQIHPGPLSYWYNRLVKRLFDIVLSLLMIIFVLSWMWPLLYLISLSGSGGLLFRQKRTGVDGGIFTCLKFRTMYCNHEADQVQACKHDSRITPVGRFLRKSSLDELPQFLNVLIGQMSVVGPRPHMLKHTSEYRHMVKRFMLRHTVKPGITGLAQVRGFRGEVHDLSDIENRVALDVNYVENWSFGLDLKIIYLTVINVVKGDTNAY
ncbi:MAG: undecaprenyl-phosphate glucose phosphotransferase [Bacteroidales bacterium]